MTRTRILTSFSGDAILRSIVYWILTVCILSNHGIGGMDVADRENSNEPSPYTSNNKVVGFIIQPRPNIDHYDSLIMILEEYVSMCEGTEIVLSGLIQGTRR